MRKTIRLLAFCGCAVASQRLQVSRTRRTSSSPHHGDGVIRGDRVVDCERQMRSDRTAAKHQGLLHTRESLRWPPRVPRDTSAARLVRNSSGRRRSVPECDRP